MDIVFVAAVIGLAVLFAWLGVPVLMHWWEQRTRRAGEPCATCEKPLRRDGFCKTCDDASDITLNSGSNRRHARLLGYVFRSTR